MALFRNVRKRKEEKRQEEAKKLQEAIESGISGYEISPEEMKDGKKLQHFIIQSCEEIIEASKELEEEKAEYRVVTEYLNDIQMLEEMPAEDMNEIKSAAESVQKLDKLRDEYHNAERHISDMQFVQMQQEEDVIPEAIKKLQANEAYQNAVKKDMHYLEGEKTEWYYNKMDLLHQQKILKTLSLMLFSIFVICTAVLLVVQMGYGADTRYAWMFVIFVAAVSGFLIFLRMNSNQMEIKQSEVNINHAIVLLNKMKFKYVNVTNAVDYAREKYHVKNAYELNYLWEQYLNEVKKREKFRQMNEDLDYFSDKLVKQLKRYRLYDSQVWMNQSSALVDNREMVEVKHNLLVRRQKLRSRIEYTTNNIKERRAQINKLLQKEHLYTPEIKEIIDSIDQLGGPQ